jgi:hypothetical protein
MSSTRGYDIGLYGLAVMGQNFALNMASHGFSVAVCNRSPDKVDLTVKRAENEGKLPLYGFKNVSDFVNSLSKPRKVVILVQAGKPVDETIEKLAEFMEVSRFILSVFFQLNFFSQVTLSLMEEMNGFRIPSEDLKCCKQKKFNSSEWESLVEKKVLAMDQA